MPHPKVKISDNSGNTVNVSDIGGTKALDVNILGATIDAGDLEINSEFPAAAAITDNFANPETTSVMSMGMGYEGSTWDRLTSTSGKLNVNTGNVTVIQDDAARTVNLITGFATATLQGAGLPASLSTGSNLKVSIEEGNITGFATSSGQLAAGHTIDCNSTFVKLKDGSGTSIVSNSGRLDVCLHSEDGTGINETGNALNVNISSGGFDGAVTGTVGHNITTIASGEMDVTTAGTALVLSATQACKKVDIQAKITNTGKIYIGGTSVDSDEGLELRRGDIYSLEIADLNDVYVDCSVSGEGVRYTWYG